MIRSKAQLSRMMLTVVAAVLLFGCVPAFSSDYYTQNPAPAFHSTTLQESAPVQVAASAFPGNPSFRLQEVPSIATYEVAFSGKPGQPSIHEGLDYVHNNPNVPHVPVIAAAAGTVAYVRTGCPQSTMFGKNKSLREAGAGWGNHVVLYHGNGIYTRYAHLAPGTVKARVGDKMIAGDVVGEMGNTGRSEVRHLHFELGYKKTYFVASKPSQSFDLVLDPAKFMPGSTPTTFVSDPISNVRSGPATSFDVVARAKRGTKLKVLEVNGSWYKVEFVDSGKKSVGWTHKSNVK